MDFKTLWSRYRSGTAGGEEISQVEAELEKFRLLEAYIEEERPPLPPPDTQRLQEELRRNRAVKKFRLGVYGEGEDGVTIAELA